MHMEGIRVNMEGLCRRTAVITFGVVEMGRQRLVISLLGLLTGDK